MYYHMGTISVIMNIFFIVGLILITISLTKTYSASTDQNLPLDPNLSLNPNPPKLADKLNATPPLDLVFHDMFNNPSPWMSDVFIVRNRKIPLWSG